MTGNLHVRVPRKSASELALEEAIDTIDCALSIGRPTEQGLQELEDAIAVWQKQISEHRELYKEEDQK